MKLRIVIFSLLAAFAAYFVTACGDNPDKTRQILDSKATALPSIPSGRYMSASGNGLEFTANSDSFKLIHEFPVSTATLSYSPLSKHLYVTLGNFSDSLTLKEGDVADKFKSLQDHYDEAKSNGEPDPFNRNSLEVKVQCVAQTSGTITGIYERPDLKNGKYGYSSAYNVFSGDPNAKKALEVTVKKESEDLQYVLQKNAKTETEKLLEQYLAEEHFPTYFNNFCKDLIFRNSSVFTNFFGNTYGGGYGSDSAVTAALGVSEWTPEIFKYGRVSNSGEKELLGLDRRLYTTNERAFDYTDFAIANFGTLLQSGQKHYGSPAIFDKDEIQLVWDFTGKSFFMKKDGGVSGCSYELQAEIQSVDYITRAGAPREDSLKIPLKVKKFEHQHCPNLNGKVFKLGDKIYGYATNGESIRFSVHRDEEDRSVLLIPESNFIKK